MMIWSPEVMDPVHELRDGATHLAQLQHGRAPSGVLFGGVHLEPE
jgi:hypothetical protein